MKRIICILLILSLLLPVYALCEDSVGEYEILLRGKWKRIGYDNVPQDNIGQCAVQIKTFSYPGTDATDTVDQPTEVTSIVTGDNTGEVYLFLAGGRYNGITVGRMYFSGNGNFLLLICPDGSLFFFVRQ